MVMAFQEQDSNEDRGLNLIQTEKKDTYDNYSEHNKYTEKEPEKKYTEQTKANHLIWKPCA